MMAEKIIEVQPDVAEVFLGGTETNPAGAVLLPGGGSDERDPGIRTVLFTDVVNSTTLTQSLGDKAALAIAWRARHDRARCVVRAGGTRGKAYRGRNHGIVCFGSERSAMRNSDSAGIGQARANEF